jgi:predicted metal-dependent hydrolase
MDKVEKILEKYKIYIGVKDVKLVVRPYKTRDAFTNLTGSPPTIYINEYLIDNEEIVEYLILRELMHIKLHMYRSRYTGGLSYAEKFENTLYFFIPKEKVEIRERIVKN